jgi:hypothetical protein
VSWYPVFTSTSTGSVSMPLTAAEQALANMREVLTEMGQKRNREVLSPAPGVAQGVHPLHRYKPGETEPLSSLKPLHEPSHKGNSP